MITTIVIPVLNGFDKLERCMSTIPDSVANVLVIDNADSDWTHDRARVLRMPSNLGVPQSWNLGIKAFPFEPGWLLLNHDAWFSDGAWDRFSADVGEDRITLAGSPPWCCAWIGRGVVDRVGLFCEVFYPAYMEDIDYERRARTIGIPVAYSDALVHHENSSTINSDYELARRNDVTHARNNAAYEHLWASVDGGVPGVSEWSLRVRCENAWGA